MTLQKEQEMYPAVEQWLRRYLQQRYPRQRIITQVCAFRRLNKLINHLGIGALLPHEWASWDVQVDIVGFVCSAQKASIVLIECKSRPIALPHLSQMIGYCRVVRPAMGLILSPKGISNSLKRLLTIFGRQDVLVYDQPHQQAARYVTLARWDAQSKSPDASSVVPSGGLS